MYKFYISGTIIYGEIKGGTALSYQWLIGTAVLLLCTLILLFILFMRSRNEEKRLESLVGNRTAELETAVKAAEAASESKSRFLANMSHEMRTPLNAIIGLSELELGAADLEGDSFINIEKIFSAGMSLLGIINDILDISKIESGKFALVPVVYDVSSMINDTVNLNIVRIGSKPIRFRLHIDGSMPAQLEGDELRIKQIFNNLLSNAIKYTDSGFVDWNISCAREGSWIKVTSTVQDTGKGISEEDQKKLFKDYFQTDLKANYYVEGTGLGLSITLNLVKLMGGTISLESEYGKGSAFTVEFFQKAVGDEVIGEEEAANLSQLRYTTHRRSLNQNLIRVDMSYASVLVVDDVVTNLDVARGMLKPYKLHIDCVTSGQEAVDRIREEKIRYSAIFMGHMMPGMDGIEAVKIIREEINTEYARTIPIIALTANALMGNDEMFLHNGFHAFLSKPIDIIRLDQILHQWVRDKVKEKEMPLTLPEETKKPQKKNAALIKRLESLGINTGAALARFANDQESYIHILGSFVVHAPSFVEAAKAFQNKDISQELESYRITVHSIKGSVWGIGAEKLGDMAEELEIAAKEGDTAFIKAKNDSLVEALERFIEALSASLDTLPDAETI